MPRFFLDTFAGEDDYNIRVDILGFPGEGIGGSIEPFQFNSNVTAEMGGVRRAKPNSLRLSVKALIAHAQAANHLRWWARGIACANQLHPLANDVG